LFQMNRRELLHLLTVAVPALSGLSADQRAPLELGLSAGRHRRPYRDPHKIARTVQS
jgi:hypothetical protein